MRKLFASLRVRLLIMVFLVVVPVLGLTLYAALEQHRLATLAVEDDTRAAVELATSQQQRLAENAHQLLSTLSLLPEIRGQDPAACNALMAQLLKEYTQYTQISEFDTIGTQYCGALPANGVTAADRAYFIRAVQSRAFSVGDYQIGRVSKKPSLGYALPLLDSAGQVQYVLYAALDLAYLNQIGTLIHLPTGSTLTVIDPTGVVLVRQPDPANWVGKNVSQTPLGQAMLKADHEFNVSMAGLNNNPSIFAIEPIDTSSQARAYIAVGIHDDVAFADANSALARDLIGLAVAACLGIALAIVGGQAFVIRQVNALVAATGRLQAGELDARTGIPHSGGELNQLAGAFDLMAAALHVSRDELEAQVKRRTAELATTNEKLVAEIAERQRVQGEREALLASESAAKREAQEAVRLKDLFLATMSHELRTPLNAMIGFQSLMIFSGQLDGDNTHMAERSLANSQRLLSLINNILDVSRIASGRLQIAPSMMSPRKLAEFIGEDLAQPAQAKGLNLEIDVDPNLPELICHDEDRLIQIATNLVGNSIKFTDAGTVRLALKRLNNRLIIEVKDTGIGIPASKQHIIFDDFVQLDSTSTRKHGGAGLGLAIVKRLVILMGGGIKVVSEIGKGSTFTVELPLELAGVPELIAEGRN